MPSTPSRKNSTSPKDRMPALPDLTPVRYPKASALGLIRTRKTWALAPRYAFNSLAKKLDVPQGPYARPSRSHTSQVPQGFSLGSHKNQKDLGFSPKVCLQLPREKTRPPPRAGGPPFPISHQSGTPR